MQSCEHKRRDEREPSDEYERAYDQPREITTTMLGFSFDHLPKARTPARLCGMKRIPERVALRLWPGRYPGLQASIVDAALVAFP